jgi:hypothetical protein
MVSPSYDVRTEFDYKYIVWTKWRILNIKEGVQTLIFESESYTPVTPLLRVPDVSGSNLRWNLIYLRSSRQVPGYDIKLGHDHFLVRPF